MNRKWIIIGIVIAVLAFYTEWQNRWTKAAPGVLVSAAPVQSQIGHRAPIDFRDYQIIPQARFNITARVLGKKRYRWGREASLAPIDLALGWGPMSDEAVIKRISISQGNRWYYYRYRNPPPIKKNEIVSHSGNMHLIPANKAVARNIKKVKRGQVVRFNGYLVNVVADDGWRWQSSLSRTDAGNRSCELVWVEHFEIQ